MLFADIYLALCTSHASRRIIPGGKDLAPVTFPARSLYHLWNWAVCLCLLQLLLLSEGTLSQYEVLPSCWMWLWPSPGCPPLPLSDCALSPFGLCASCWAGGHFSLSWGNTSLFSENKHWRCYLPVLESKKFRRKLVLSHCPQHGNLPFEHFLTQGMRRNQALTWGPGLYSRGKRCTHLSHTPLIATSLSWWLEILPF